MGLIQRWLNIGGPRKKDFEDLAASAIEALAKAKDEHISDLRLLIDKSHQREAQLSEMVKLAMEHQFYRPVITGTRPAENRVSAALPPEALSDVQVYDEKADAELMQQQQEALKELIAEQNEQGLNKVH